MNGRHATAEELEFYVLGAARPEASGWLETHCAQCPSCAIALAKEAQFEMAFARVASQSLRNRVTRPVRAAGYTLAGAMAMAAAFCLWVGRAPGSAATTGVSESIGMGIGGRGGIARRTMDDAAILDARNDALDGG